MTQHGFGGSALPFVAASLVASASFAGGMGRIKVGEPFPALTLPLAEDGRPSSVDDYRGQKVVLHVFASW